MLKVDLFRFFLVFLLPLLTLVSFEPPAGNVDFQVDLINPVFKNGVLTTEEGGIITADGIKIQARKIAYTNRIENGIAVRKIVAEEDLLVQSENQAFVGKKLEYDFILKNGMIEEGKTRLELWFVGGDKIYLQADGSYYVVNAFITTSACDEPLWEVHAGKIRVSENKLMTAKNLKFKVGKIPFFWIPKLKANLKAIYKPPIRYKVKWDKGLGPRISARYRVYSWENLDIFLRGDYRVTKGGGGALETEYRSEDHLTEFISRSYGSIHDPSTPIMKGPDEFRFQGLFKSQSVDDKTHFNFAYDKISSQKMIAEFKSDDFEVDTKQRTYLFFDHITDKGFADLRFQPRINFWQSLKQELPSLTFGLRPVTLGTSGIVMQNWTNAAFLDYVYAREARPFIHNRHAARLQTINSLYFPIPTGPITWTPEAGIVAIFYNNDLERQSIGQAIGTYGCRAETRLVRKYALLWHSVIPYAAFRGLSKPTASSDKVIIFSLKDGYHVINAVRFGLINNFSPLNQNAPPRFSADLFAYAFFGTRGPLSAIPRLYAFLTSEYPSCLSNLEFIWNIQQHLVDRINVRTEWTVNERIAFILEFRHRSRFDFRKSDPDNFMLDVARSFNQLLRSPLSDGRNTILAAADLRIHPLWTLRFSGHFGWGRSKEPSYHSAKIDLYTTWVTGWKIRLSAATTADDVQFDGGVELVRY